MLSWQKLKAWLLKDQPNPKGMILFGKSMKPSMGFISLVWGDWQPDFVCVGDVVAFSRKKKPLKVMHRVINISSDGRIFIKGDNATKIDCVNFSDIHFKVNSYRNLV
jgi:hypothetical protein